MRDKLRALTGVESPEEPGVSMLLTQSVFLGFFLGAFDISAHSILLSTFDEKIMARGYVFSGFAGLIITSLFYRFQNRIKFRYFSEISLSGLAVLTFILWIAFVYFPSDRLVFILFILLGPVNILTLLCFWGTAERLFTKKQLKRLSQLNETGLVAGIIVISYAIPVLMYFNLHSYNILLAGTASVLAGTVIQFIIGPKFSLAGTDTIQLPEVNKKSKKIFTVIFEDRYFRIIGIFAALSVIVAFFIQYSFMAVARQQYPAAEEMATFLGLFTGTTLIFMQIIKRFGFEYFLYNYGMRTCIIISPVIIAILSFVVVTIGFLTGISPSNIGGFILFFVFLLISRLLSRTLKEFFEAPSLRVICQPLEQNMRSKLNNFISGSFNEIMVIFSGLILTVLGLTGFFRLLHFTILLFGISLIWLFVSFRLYREYRKSLLSDRAKAKQKVSESDFISDNSNFRNRLSAEINFHSDYFRLITGDFSVLDKISNIWYFKKIIEFANSNKDINLLPVLNRIANTKGLDEEIRRNAADVAAFLKIQAESEEDYEKINESLKILSGSRRPQTTEILRLLRNNSPESKRLAIYMIGKFRLPDLLPEVCGCMSIPGLTKDAFEVLTTFGPDAEDQLIRFYVVSSGNTDLCKTILRLLANTNSSDTISFLFSRLWSNSRQLKELTVKLLIINKFTPSEEEKQRLVLLASEVIGIITWNLSAKISLAEEHDDFLLDKVNYEIQRWTEFLFNTLSVTYGIGNIAMIREVLESESKESVSYASELMNLEVSDLLLPKLISLFDTVSDKDKLDKLFHYFPGEILNHRDLREDIINRDYNLISLWTKACVLRSIVKIESKEMEESVAALLFSPEEIIQEESANLIGRSNPEIYFSVSGRIPGSINKRLNEIIIGNADRKGFLFEKIKFLSIYFKGIAEDDLLPLAKGLWYFTNTNAESIIRFKECILWISSSQKDYFSVHVLYGGENLPEIYRNVQNTDIYFLPFITIEDYQFQFPDKSDSILQFLDDNEK